MGRHAYLVIAHNNFEILKKQIKLLDYPGNDIYIHVDKKTEGFDEADFASIPVYSGIYFIPRKNLYWADYSQVDVDLDLMEYASSRGNYDYYHIISGVDMPLKTQKFIHDSFENNDRIFIGIVPETMKYCDNSIHYYYFFTDNKFYRNCKPIKLFNRLFMYFQKLIGINRLRGKNFDIYNGWDWVSLPQDFVEYVLAKKDFIYDVFHHTLNPIEMFLQSLAYNSPEFRNRLKDTESLVNGSMRYVDWKRGRPYTFRKEDFEEVMDSNCYFARKFDENVDFEIVEMIFDKVYQKQTEELG